MIAGKTGSRCPECGRVTVINGHCKTCSRQVEVAEPVVPVANSIIRGHSVSSPSWISAPVDGPELTRTPAYLTPGANQRSSLIMAIREVPPTLQQGEVSGRVIWVRPGGSERMDFDPWRWVAIPVWGLLTLVAPIFVTLVIWQQAGALMAVLSGFVSLIVVRHIFSHRVLHAWHLTAALNGHHIVEPMPVTLLRVREEDGNERQLRLKGEMIGLPIEGDRIVARGAWRRGVLKVRQLECLRTGALLIPLQPCARTTAIIGLLLLGTSALWLVFDAVPRTRTALHQWRETHLQTSPHFPDQRFYP